MPPRSPSPGDGFAGLLLHLLKTSGLGSLVAVAFGFALIQVYQDLGRRNDAFIDLLRANLRESRAVSDSLEQLSREIQARRELSSR